MTVRKEYRVHGRDDYIIDYVPQSDGTYDLYCRQHPADRHGQGPSHHHLYESDKICVAEGREPRSLADAEMIGKAWVEGWSEYIQTGEFPA